MPLIVILSCSRADVVHRRYARIARTLYDVITIRIVLQAVDVTMGIDEAHCTFGYARNDCVLAAFLADAGGQLPQLSIEVLKRALELRTITLIPCRFELVYNSRA